MHPSTRPSMTPLPSRAVHGKGFLHDARRGFRQVKSRKFLLARECHVGYVTPSFGLAADSLTKIIRNDEVKSRSWLGLNFSRSITQVNPVEHLDQLKDPDLDARFFPQFSSYSFYQTFAELQRAARNGPFTEQRLAAAADQQRATLIDNHPPDANYWPFGAFSGGGHSNSPSARDRMAFKAVLPCTRADFVPAVYNTLHSGGHALRAATFQTALRRVEL